MALPLLSANGSLEEAALREKEDKVAAVRVKRERGKRKTKTEKEKKTEMKMDVGGW